MIVKPACSPRRGGRRLCQWGSNKQFEGGRWWACWSSSQGNIGCQWNSKSNPGAPREPPLWTCPTRRIPTNTSWQCIRFATWSCGVVEGPGDIVIAKPRQVAWCCLPGSHLCHDQGLESLSGPRPSIHLEEGFNHCCKGTGAWTESCTLHPKVDSWFCPGREVSPPFLSLWPPDSPWGWRCLTGNPGGIVRESKKQLCQGWGPVWDCHEREVADLVRMAGDLQAHHFSVDGTAMACKNELAIQKNEEWNVYWWPWARRCCGISTGICPLMGSRIQNSIPNLGQWWKSPYTNLWFFAPHSCHTRWIHLLPKRQKEDSLEPSRQPTNAQTERRRAVFNGLGFFDSQVGTLVWSWQVSGSFFFCHIHS